MIIGGVVFGALVARVAAAIDKRNPQEQAFNKKMYELKLFLAEVGVSLPIRDKAKVRLRSIVSHMFQFINGIFSFLDRVHMLIIFKRSLLTKNKGYSMICLLSY
jgi:hypothetical protein